MQTHQNTKSNGNGHDNAGKPGKQVNRLKRGELLRVYDLLKQHGKVDGTTYIFAEGWSDDVIRKAVNPELPETTYAEFRREEFGRLATEIKRLPRGPNSPVFKRVAELEETVVGLKETVADLVRRLEAVGA